MKTNILIALRNLLKSKNNNQLINFYNNKNSNNRINDMGTALEYYIKDLFCSSLEISDFKKKDEIYNKYLSYLGNKNNPPDFIIKQSSAVEVKKNRKSFFWRYSFE